jgi:hypothetical protein
MQMFTTPNYYISTLRLSKELTSYKTVEFGDIYMRVGQTESGSLIVQSLLFPKSKYSFSKATIMANHLSKIL